MNIKCDADKYTMDDYNIVKSDFDEIADLPNPPKWNHNNCYFNYLLEFLPNRVGKCLDIGCGQGELSALLAKRSEKVVAVDLSSRMIERATEDNSLPNIEYICGNILEMTFADKSLDVIITTATAHHLAFEWLLTFAKQKLKNGGIFIVLDLVKAETLSDKVLWGFAAVPNVFMNITKNGRLIKDDPHSAAVWKKHGEHDTYMTLNEIKALTEKHLPNALIRRKLFWRYVLVWKK